MKEWDVAETRIQLGGVMRCCVASVAQEYTGKKVKLGDKSVCQYCNLPFTLVTQRGKKPHWQTLADYQAPIWTPDWQLQKEAQ